MNIASALIVAGEARLFPALARLDGTVVGAVVEAASTQTLHLHVHTARFLDDDEFKVRSRRLRTANGPAKRDERGNNHHPTSLLEHGMPPAPSVAGPFPSGPLAHRSED